MKIQVEIDIWNDPKLCQDKHNSCKYLVQDYNSTRYCRIFSCDLKRFVKAAIKNDQCKATYQAAIDKNNPKMR